jgi:hypothetical protein
VSGILAQRWFLVQTETTAGIGDTQVMIAKSNEPTWSENFVYTDSSNYRGGSHLAGKPGRQWRNLPAYFLISLVGCIFVPPMTLAITDKGVQTS